MTRPPWPGKVDAAVIAVAVAVAVAGAAVAVAAAVPAVVAVGEMVGERCSAAARTWPWCLQSGPRSPRLAGLGFW